MVVRLWVSPLLPVAPDTINNHVKTCREEQKNLHFFAPEYGGEAFQFSCPLPILFSTEITTETASPSLLAYKFF